MRIGLRFGFSTAALLSFHARSSRLVTPGLRFSYLNFNEQTSPRADCQGPSAASGYPSRIHSCRLRWLECGLASC